MNFSSIDDIPNLSARAVFTSCSDEVYREDKDIFPVPVADGVSYMPWGANNDMPYKVLDLIESDETMTTCLQFTAECCYGAGLVYDVCKCNDVAAVNEVEEFMRNNDIPYLFMGCCQDFKHFGFSVCVVILSRDGSKILRIVRKQACYCRFAPADSSGHIPYVLYANWRLPIVAPDDIEVIEALDFNSPWSDLAVRMGRLPGDDGIKAVRSNSRKFAVFSRIPTADNTYYPIPFYASLFRSKWYDIKRLIATAKKSKLENAAPIKYHIEIAARYWDEIFKRERITDHQQKLLRVEKGKEEILEFLTGAENSGKAWFSTFFVSPDGVEMHEVKITKVDSSKEGGDWESEIQEAVNMICFAMRVHTNLVGSVPGKSQTNNSGSDKRELYLIAQAMQKPYRDLLFAPHRIVINFNGWKNVFPDCPFIQLTTLDEHVDAKQVSLNNDI